MKNLVIGIGEALWDILPDGKKIGGAPANFSYHVSQFGLNSLVISAVGHDKLGNEILSDFDGKLLNHHISKVEYPTGTVQVELDNEGVPYYDIRENVAWDNIPFTDSMKGLAQRAKAVCFGSLSQRNIVSRTTIHQFLDEMPDEGTYKIFDINLRQGFYTKEILCTSMQKCNILKINDEELIAVSRMFGYPGIDLKDKCWILLALKSATKLFSVLLASKRPLITELADKLRLKYPLLPTISPCPTMRLEAIRSIIPISCRRYPKSV